MGKGKGACAAMAIKPSGGSRRGLRKEYPTAYQAAGALGSRGTPGVDRKLVVAATSVRRDRENFDHSPGGGFGTYCSWAMPTLCIYESISEDGPTKAPLLSTRIRTDQGPGLPIRWPSTTWFFACTEADDRLIGVKTGLFNAKLDRHARISASILAVFCKMSLNRAISYKKRGSVARGDMVP